MGCGASTEATPIELGCISTAPLATWSAAEVDSWLLSLGSAFAAYTSKATKLNINNGAFLVKLAAMASAEANAKLQSRFNILHDVHREVLLDALAELVRQSHCPQFTAVSPVSPSNAVGARGACSATAGIPKEMISLSVASTASAAPVRKNMTLWQTAKAAAQSVTGAQVASLAAKGAAALVESSGFPGASIVAEALRSLSTLILQHADRPKWLEDFRVWIEQVRSDVLAAKAEFVRRAHIDALVDQLAAADEELRAVLERPNWQQLLASGVDQKKLEDRRAACEKIKAEAMPSMLIEIKADTRILGGKVDDVQAAIGAILGEVAELGEQQAVLTKKTFVGMAEMNTQAQVATQHTRQLKAAVTQASAEAKAHHAETLTAITTIAAGGAKLPARISNLPRICAHFTPRESIMKQLSDAYAAAASTNIDMPIAALTGIPGSGKSELAKQFALREFTRQTNAAAAAAASAAASSSVKPEEEEKRLCWFLNAESNESLMRSYRALCWAFKLEWKAEPAETEVQTLARMAHDWQEKIRVGGYDVLLLFDNAVTFAALQLFLPNEAGLRARVLVTSLNDALLTSNAVRGHFALSLNDGLSDDEAISLLQSTSCISDASTRSDQLLLVTELDHLPLAISTAGLYIAAIRQPKRGRGAATSASSQYDAAAFLKDLRARSSDWLNREASLGSQSDYKVGQSKALQMAIERSPPHFRRLLDYCSLLDSQALPYDLLVELLTHIVQTDPEADPSTVASKAAAADAFDELLSLPEVCSLIWVDTGTNRLFLHRITQLQVIVLAETELKSPQQVRRATGQGALDASILRAPPTPLQQWQSGLTLETLAAIQRVWPTREEDVSSLFALESVTPTIVRLVDQCAILPMAHETNSKLLAELFKRTQLLHMSFQERELDTEMQHLAAAMQKITLPSSEVHQWQILWDAVALYWLDEDTKAIKQLQALHTKLQRDHASSSDERLQLRAHVLLQLADLNRRFNPSLALTQAEASLTLLSKWQGEHARTVQTVRVWRVLTGIHWERDAPDLGLECARKSLDAAKQSCGHHSVHAAKVHLWLADVSTTRSTILEHFRTALDIFDSTVGMGPTSSAAVAACLDLGQTLESDEAMSFLKERRDLLLQKLGEHERTAKFIADAADIIWPLGDHAEALQWDEDALAMRSRLHGPYDARTVEQEAQVAERLYLLGEEEDIAADAADLDSSASVKGAKEARATKMNQAILTNLPRVTGRLPVILSKIGNVAEHFSQSGDDESALKVGRWCLELAKAKVGEDDLLTATQYFAVGALHWNLRRHEQALPYYQSCLALRVAHGDLAQAAFTAHWIAQTNERIGNRKAEEQFRLRALQLAVQSAGHKTTGAAEQHANLAAMYVRRAQCVPALKHSLQALRIRQLLEFGVQAGLAEANAIYRKMRKAVAPAQRAAKLQEGIDAAVQDSSEWDAAAAGIAYVNGGLLALNGSETVAEVRAMVLPLLDSALKLLMEHKQALPLAHGLAAKLANRCGDLGAALAASKVLLASLQEEKVNDLSAAQQQLALARCWLSQYEQATPLFEQSLAGFRDKYGVISYATKRAESLLQWCRRQRTVSSAVNHSHLPCLLAFPDPSTIAVQSRLTGIQAAVVFGAAAGNADVAHPYKLRPLSPAHPNVLYYEVTIGAGEAKGMAPGCTIGFSSGSHLLCSSPGAESASIGLRTTQTAPSVLLYSDGGVNSDYAPKVNSGSVVGAGIDTAAGFVFFTIDGVRYKDVPAEVSRIPFACLAVGDDDESASTFALNFGDAPFKYQPSEQLHHSTVHTRVDPQCSWLVTFDSPLELGPIIQRARAYFNVLLHNTAAFPLRTLPNSTILYYELQLVASGVTNLFSFGYGRADATCTDTPGWTDPPSVGYGARTGQIGVHLLSPSHGAIVGPVIKLHDVCGCGLDRDAGIVFFVINGQRLADAVIKDAHLLVAPMCGFGPTATTEKIRLNFGDSPFKYNHTAYLQAITASPLPALPANFPFRQPHKHCSWLVIFDSPLELRRTMPQPGVSGGVLLSDASTFPLRALPNSRILYMELTLLSDAADCALGFADAVSVNVTQLPGASAASVGYIGASGRLISNGVHCTPAAYGPRWTRGDVIGIGLEQDSSRRVFFVHNGVRLKSIAVTDAELLSLCVGFGPTATNERVQLNFGALPFTYIGYKHGGDASVAAVEDELAKEMPGCSWLIDVTHGGASCELRRAAGSKGTVCSVLLSDAALYPVRPLPHSSMLYFEVELLDSGAPSMAGLGWVCVAAGARWPLHRMPGWERRSVGLHGDDGAVYKEGSATVKNYSPVWKTGDVVGCGLDRAAGLVFFVLNGRRLPDVAVSFTAELAPCVGFGRGAMTERVRLNFGDTPFEYDP